MAFCILNLSGCVHISVVYMTLWNPTPFRPEAFLSAARDMSGMQTSRKYGLNPPTSFLRVTWKRDANTTDQVVPIMALLASHIDLICICARRYTMKGPAMDITPESQEGIIQPRSGYAHSG